MFLVHRQKNLREKVTPFYLDLQKQIIIQIFQKEEDFQ